MVMVSKSNGYGKATIVSRWCYSGVTVVLPAVEVVYEGR
jgi:hypothetical protein